MRVLRQPVPKSKLLNKTNYKAWCASKLDLRLAEHMLLAALPQQVLPSSPVARALVSNLPVGTA